MSGAPKCPLRQDMMGKMPECDDGCAWLMKMNDTCQNSVCAVAVIARWQSKITWMPVNYRNEVDE